MIYFAILGFALFLTPIVTFIGSFACFEKLMGVLRVCEGWQDVSLVATGARAIVVAAGRRSVVVVARCATRGRVGLLRDTADGSAANGNLRRCSDGGRSSDSRGFGVGRRETFRRDFGFLQRHLRLSELRVGSTLGSRRTVGLRRGSGATRSSSARGEGGDLSGRRNDDGILGRSGVGRGTARHGTPSDLPDFREALVMDEVGLEVVEREKVVDAHAGPEGGREQEFSVGGPFVMSRSEGLSRAELGQRDSVPDVKVAGKLTKAAAHEHATLRTPDKLVARLGTEVTKSLALAIVEGSFGRIFAVSDRKIVSLGVPTHVVDGALLISSNVALSLTVSRQVVEVGVSIVVVGTRLIALSRRKHKKRLASIVPVEGNVVTVVEALGRDGLSGRKCREEVDGDGPGLLFR